MAYTFSDPTADSNRNLQYFETAGYRGLVNNGWKAVTAHEPGTPFEEDHWELYHIDEDFSESHDLAEQWPEKLEEMKHMWFEQAKLYDVLPLDDRMGQRIHSTSPHLDENRYLLLPGTRLLNSTVGPYYAGRAFEVSAIITDRGEGEQGVLLAFGRRAFGFSLFIKDEFLVFDYNLAGRHTMVTSSERVPTGATRITMRLDENSGGARVQLFINDRPVGERATPTLLPGGLGGLTTQCGYNGPSAVSAEYTAPFSFEGDLHSVVIRLEPHQNDTSEADWASEMARQ